VNTNARARADVRSRSAGKLRNLTIGTTLAAVAATGALTGLAATSGIGSPDTTGTTTAVVSTSDSGIGSSSTAAGTSSSTTTTPSIVSVGGGAHVSSGGS
jgi:hypothetical protein